MQLMSRRYRFGRRASVSVEFALISVFFLMPLLAGAVDFACIVNARAQLNTALQALIYYAWTNNSAAQSNAGTTSGGETTLITAINSASIFHITYSSSSSSLKYACVTSSNGSYTVPATLNNYTASSTCSSGTLQLFIQYTITANVGLPLPLPLSLANPYPLTVTGTAEI